MFLQNKSDVKLNINNYFRQKSRAGVLHDNNGAMSPPPPRGPDQDKIKVDKIDRKTDGQPDKLQTFIDRWQSDKSNLMII